MLGLVRVAKAWQPRLNPEETHLSSWLNMKDKGASFYMVPSKLDRKTILLVKK